MCPHCIDKELRSMKNTFARFFLAAHGSLPSYFVLVLHRSVGACGWHSECMALHKYGELIYNVVLYWNWLGWVEFCQVGFGLVWLDLIGSDWLGCLNNFGLG